MIDSDAKVAEMYEKLRKEDRRNAQHCMPVKQIPDLQWEKERAEPPEMEHNAKKNTEKRTGPTLRSSKTKHIVNEVKEQVEAMPTKDKEQISTDFFSVAGTVKEAGVYTVAAQFINKHLF